VREADVGTTVRRSTLTLPGAPVGPPNPLPALLPPQENHTLTAEERAALPPRMARQIPSVSDRGSPHGYAPLHTVLPTRVLDGYTRHRTPTVLDTVVVENDRLRAVVLPGLGGRVHSLLHKPTGRDLLYTNPVLQPANFALNGAWFSGGIEWNIGATGHTTLSCAPVHAARVTAPDGGQMLRLWEWERLRDTPFQVDLWLPEGSDFLHVGVRIRNPHDDRTVPVYWWSNIAVPEEEHTRVLAPADAAWHFGYARSLRRVPVPAWDGADRSYPLRSAFPADYFYEVPDAARKWITSLDADGRGLVQTSTDTLGGRKLFVWGSGPGGRRWQRWLTQDGTPGYAEIQAGLARTQLEHVPLEAGEEFSWLEAYGPLETDTGAVHGADWAAARAHVEERLAAALPRPDLEAAHAAWRARSADAEPEAERLAVGSGWGALEAVRAGYHLPGTPFEPATLGPEQRPWLALLHTGRFPEGAGGGADGRPPGPSLVSAAWRDQLECAPSGPLTDYHLGVAQWHAGDHAQAVRSWERALAAGSSPWALRCLALADAHDAGLGPHPQRAAERYLAAADGMTDATALTALVREAVPVLLTAGRAAEAGELLARLPADQQERGRFRLLHARIRAAEGEAADARKTFEAGFEVDDLREGEETLNETWARITDEPLPEVYEFRMRPS
jgi:uncharacterized protein DUF5107